MIPVRSAAADPADLDADLTGTPAELVAAGH
jgi:hypothetical protein